MTTAISDHLRQLTATIADWVSEVPACTVYLFGSHVRGDHHSASDVDICIPIPSPVDDDTFAWLADQLSHDFEDLKRKLPAVRVLRDSPDVEAKIIAARVIYSDRNVRCVWLPPK